MVPFDDSVPPLVIESVAEVLAPGVPKPGAREPAPTASCPSPVTEPPLIASVPVEPAASPMALNRHAATDAQAIRPPLETVTTPVPQLPMLSPLNAAPPVRFTVLPAPVTLTTPVPSPPVPGTICAAVRMPPAVTLTVPIPPTPPEVLPMKIGWPVRSTTAAGANGGLTSPDSVTFATARSADENASTSATTVRSQRNSLAGAVRAERLRPMSPRVLRKVRFIVIPQREPSDSLKQMSPQSTKRSSVHRHDTAENPANKGARE